MAEAKYTLPTRDWTLATPVVFIIFNRPETTQRVFEQIAKVEPSELFVIADGPRTDCPADQERCETAREILEKVDWDCEIHRNFASQNMGIRRRIPTGLDWVFEHVEEAIILEDDCLPNPSFFRFCQRMLDEYRTDERVMEITGSNHLGKWKDSKQDYHFSIYGGIWGWATWRRSWQQYDVSMERWVEPEMQRRVRDFLADDQQFRYIKRVFDRTYEEKIDTWDYQWQFTKYINSGLSIVPSKNLVSNIGFGAGATNTTEDSPLAEQPRHQISFPIKVNNFVVADRDYDREYYEVSNSMWEKNWMLRQVRNTYFKLFKDA